MYEFKKNERVIVCGYGKVDGKFYKDVPATIIERDPYYKDYHVKFKNGTEDWLSPQYIRKPYSRKMKRRE